MLQSILKESVQIKLPPTASPKDYLKVEEGDSFVCSICFQPQLEMLFCNESCSKSFCKICYANFDYGDHSEYCQGAKMTCRNRQNPQFFCPSNSIQCTLALTSEQQFQKHCLDCQYIQQKVRCQFRARRNYQCLNDHKLSFSKIKTICSLCNNYHYSSSCRLCQISICFRCRIIPCTKTQCPRGHNLILNPSRNSVICDLCNISMQNRADKNMYSDRQCNFDVCQSCYLSLVDQCQIKYIQENQNHSRYYYY